MRFSHRCSGNGAGTKHGHTACLLIAAVGMTLTPLRVVLFLALLLTSSSSLAQSFSGPYAGVEAGMQHLIGGSLVEGVDTLQEDTRRVVSVFGGVRLPLRRLVFGVELGRGATDGDLRLEQPALSVDYRNGSQWHWALHAGPTIGERTLVFGYLSEVTRDFDVTISQAGQTTEQADEQGMLRFGGGVEQRLTNRLHLRVSAGTSRADFGNRATNITIGRKVEFGAALVVQF